MSSLRRKNPGGADPRVGKLGFERWKWSAWWRTSLCDIKTNQTVTVGSCLDIGLVGTCLPFLFVCCDGCWGGKKKPPPTQLPLGSREAGGQVIQRRCVMGSSLSMPRIGGMCQLCNWRLGMAAISCSPQVILPWDHPPKPINVFLKPQLGERTVGDKKKKEKKKKQDFLKACVYKRNDRPVSQEHICRISCFWLCVRHWAGEKHRGFTQQSATSNKVADVWIGCWWEPLVGFFVWHPGWAKESGHTHCWDLYVDSLSCLLRQQVTIGAPHKLWPSVSAWDKECERERPGDGRTRGEWRGGGVEVDENWVAADWTSLMSNTLIIGRLSWGTWDLDVVIEATAEPFRIFFPHP